MGARKSAKYIFIGNLFSKLITFIGSIVLARILFPEDYGYLLMAMIVTGFAQTLGNMGLENYYLQEKIRDKEHEKNILNVTFKVRLVLNSIMFFIQFFGSYFVADYYGQVIVGELLRLFSFNYLISGISIINLYILRKKLNYKVETFANVSRDIISTALKVVCALMGFGVLSFAYGNIIGNIIKTSIILYKQKFCFDLFVWDKIEFKRILYFGKHSLVGGIGNYFSEYIDKIFITKFFSSSESGYYSFAHKQSSTIFNYIVYPQNSLFLSYIAKYKLKPDYLVNVLSTLSYIIGISLLPIVLFLFVYAEPIFQFVFGIKWSNSILLFQMFLIFKYLRVLIFPLMPILTGFGYPQIVSKLSIIRLFILGILLLGLLQFSSNVYYYAFLYMSIVFIFDLVKGAWGLKIMNYQLSFYLSKMYFVTILVTALLQLIILYSIKYFIIDTFSQILVSIIILIFSSLLFYSFFQWQKIFSAIELIFGKNHKVIQFFQKYIFFIHKL